MMRPVAHLGAALAGMLAAAAALCGCADQGAASAEAAGQPTAATAPSAARRCFWPRDVNGWRAADNQTVYVRVGVNRVFRMRLMGPCPDIDWSQRVGIQSFGGTQICSGIDATIIAPSRIGPRRCPVTELTELTPAEVAAMPARNRP
jgi:hypothetical protein